MRKLKIVLAILGLILLIGGSIAALFLLSETNKNAKVVTTIFPIYDVCREILGDDDDIVLLQDNGADMHSFQLTASDINVISKSELFIFIGGESDEWVSSAIQSTGRKNLKTLSLMDEIEKLEETHEGVIEGHSSEECHDDECTEEHIDNNHEFEGHEHGYDEHIWLSIKNMIEITKSITKSLLDIFPEKTVLIKDNSEEYLEKLRALDEEYESSIKDSEKSVVIADRFPFRYLVNDYNIKYLAAFSGCSTETEASLSVITGLINKLNSENLNHVLILENSDSSLARSVVEGTGRSIEILKINSCQSISVSQIDNVCYLDIMKSNLEILKKVLN